MIRVKCENKIIVDNVSVAQTFWSRFSGYMMRSRPHVQGILFIPAISIHTFFMRFSLDIVFMDRHHKIMKIYRNMKPWRHTSFYFRSHYTLEVPSGDIPHWLKEGHVLEIENV